MGDANPICTIGDYSRPSHEGYRNTIEIPEGNNVVPLRSDTIRLVQNGCSFYELRSEDPNQHLKDFLKLVDSLDLDVANRERTRLLLFQFSFRDQARNWLKRLPTGSISTWEDFTTRFLAQFSPPRRTAKLCNDILMFQQHQGESLSEAWARFKDLLQKFPRHGIDLWLQVQIFYDRINEALNKTIDYAAEGRLKKLSEEKAWATIKKLSQYEDEGWNDPVILEEGSLDFENPDLEQLLGVMECKVGTLMEKAISLMGRSESVFGMPSNMIRQLPPEPSRQEAFEDLVMNFILDQEERVKQLKEYKGVIGSDFMQLSLKVVEKLKDEIRAEENRVKKIEKITREIPNFDEPEPQSQPLPSCPSLDISLGEERGPEPPIKPYSPDSFRMKVVDKSTINTPPSPHVASFHLKDLYCYYHSCIDDPKKHYGFKPGLLGHSGSLGVDFSNMEMIENKWELESKEVSFLG
ncbi:zinc finger, CCHC-type containing protein [Tanacetum coccineum]|uniref:Zinc finger, CCHC-type containing protein n=1 Tax=Tanacetum coccineum TaxID=301880 RepID=A0ABQ5J2B1_9ASTR